MLLTHGFVFALFVFCGKVFAHLPGLPPVTLPLFLLRGLLGALTVIAAQLVLALSLIHILLISSHLLGEIEQMVDQVGILNHGRLLFEGSLQQLQKHSRGGILLRVLDAPKAAAVLQQQGVKSAVPTDQPDTLQLPPLPDEALAALVCTLAESGVGVVGLTAQTKSLEDIFLSLTQTSREVA